MTRIDLQSPAAADPSAFRHRRLGGPFLNALYISLIAALPVLCASHSHADTTSRGALLPIKCDRVLRPVNATDASGARLYGSITVNARIVDGRVDQVEVADGRPELLQAARESLEQYTCASYRTPRVLTAVFDFPAPGPFTGGPAKSKSPFDMVTVMAPPSTTAMARRKIVSHNAAIHALFPLRADALLDAETLEGKPYRSFKVINDVQPELIAAHMNHVGRWKVKLTYLVNADGTASDFIVESDAPAAFHRTSIAAMRKSTYAPATYGDQPVATVIEREFTYTIEDDEPAQPAAKSSEAARRKPGMKG